MDAREVSLLALNDCQRQGGWSDAILKKRLANNRLDSRDGALATQLCFGVLQTGCCWTSTCPTSPISP